MPTTLPSCAYAVMEFPGHVGSSIVTVMDAIGCENLMVIGAEAAVLDWLVKQYVPQNTEGVKYGAIHHVVAPHVPVAAVRSQGCSSFTKRFRMLAAAARASAHGVRAVTTDADVYRRISNAPRGTFSTRRGTFD